MADERVAMTKDGTRTVSVMRSAFDKVWSKRGWLLADDEVTQSMLHSLMGEESPPTLEELLEDDEEEDH